MFWIILALYTVAAVSANDERPCHPYPNGTKANDIDNYSNCSHCSYGHGMSQYCVIVRIAGQECFKDTLCSECVSGTYQDQKKHVETCKICTACDREKGLQVSKPCTSVSNTECGCAPGFYFNTEMDKCVQCAHCLAGSEPSECSTNSDSTCRQCNNGTFSDGKSSCKPCRTCDSGELVERQCTVHSDTVCKPCRTCSSGELIEKLCTAHNDTVCKPCRTCGSEEQVEKLCTAYSDTVCIALSAQRMPGASANDVEMNDWIIYLSCGLMALVALTVACYAVWKHFNRQMDKKRTNGSLHGDASVQLYACTKKAQDMDKDMDSQHQGNNTTTVTVKTDGRPAPAPAPGARATNGHAKSKSNRARLDRDCDPTQVQVLIDTESEHTST